MSIDIKLEKLSNIKNKFKTIMVENNIPIQDAVPFEIYPDLIRNNIGLLTDVQTDLKNAIEEKGVDVPDDARINSYADYIKQIETGADLSEWIKFFEEDRPTAITIPNGVKKLGSYLFYNKSWITSVQGETVEEIGSYCFTNCSSLGEVNFSNASKIREYAFQSSGISKCNFPKLTEMGNYAFSHCSELKTFEAPQLTEIPDYAFNNSGIENVSFSPNLTKIGYSAFDTVDNLTIRDMSLFKNLTFIAMNAFKGNLKIYGDIIFNQPIEFDWNHSFYQVRGSFNITFNAPVVLEGASFFNCNSLKCVNFNNQDITITGNNNYYKTFDSCYYLREVKGFSGAVPDYCFYDNRRLTDFDFSNVTELDNSAFYNAGFEQIEFPNILNLRNCSFTDCQYLKYVGIKNGAVFVDSIEFSQRCPIRIVFLSKKLQFNNTANVQMFINASSDLKIYTDFVSEDELPQNLRANNSKWANIDDSTKAQIIYNATYEDYLQAVEEDKKECHKFVVTGELSQDDIGFYNGFSTDNYINCPKTDKIDAYLSRELVLHIKTGDDVATPQGIIGQANSSNSDIHLALKNEKLVITIDSTVITAEDIIIEPQTEYWIKLIFNQEREIAAFLATKSNEYTQIIQPTDRGEKNCYMIIGQPFYASDNYEAFKGSINLNDTVFSLIE